VYKFDLLPGLYQVPKRRSSQFLAAEDKTLGGPNILMIEVVARKLIVLLLLAVAPGHVFLIQVAAIYPSLLTLSIILSGLGAQLSGISQINYAIAGLSLARIVLVLIALCILCVSQPLLDGSGGHGFSSLGSLQSVLYV